MSPISLSQNIQPVSKVFESKIDYVTLPFPALILNWNNGNPRDSKAEGAKHFGGWSRGEGKITEDLTSMNMTDLPGYFTPVTDWVNQGGGTYQARSSRYIYAAPIRAKVDWYDEVDQRTGKKALTHRLDFLVYLADATPDHQLIPWGPAVLRAGGYSASGIEDAFKNWVRETSNIRISCAPGVSDIFFYRCVGTFGDARVTKKVGERMIVPCQYNKPSEWTPELLEKLFVGEDIAALMVDLQIQSEAWATDLNSTRQKEGRPVGPSQTGSVEFATYAPENFTDEPPF